MESFEQKINTNTKWESLFTSQGYTSQGYTSQDLLELLAGGHSTLAKRTARTRNNESRKAMVERILCFLLWCFIGYALISYIDSVNDLMAVGDTGGGGYTVWVVEK